MSRLKKSDLDAERINVTYVYGRIKELTKTYLVLMPNYYSDIDRLILYYMIIHSKYKQSTLAYIYNISRQAMHQRMFLVRADSSKYSKDFRNYAYWMDEQLYPKPELPNVEIPQQEAIPKIGVEDDQA